MAILMVTYDLRAPGRDYDDLHDALAAYTHCKKLESFWLLDTTLTCAQVRDDLGQHIDKNDVLFVAELKKHWAALRYGCAEWLKSPARSW
jgi:hypothetical protein